MPTETGPIPAERDGYRWSDLLADLQKLTPEQLENHVEFFDSYQPVFPSALFVPTEDQYLTENDEFIAASEITGDPYDEYGDVVVHAGCPILIEEENDDQ